MSLLPAGHRKTDGHRSPTPASLLISPGSRKPGRWSPAAGVQQQYCRRLLPFQQQRKNVSLRHPTRPWCEPFLIASMHALIAICEVSESLRFAVTLAMEAAYDSGPCANSRVRIVWNFAILTSWRWTASLLSSLSRSAVSIFGGGCCCI